MVSKVKTESVKGNGIMFAVIFRVRQVLCRNKVQRFPVNVVSLTEARDVYFLSLCHSKRSEQSEAKENLEQANYEVNTRLLKVAIIGVPNVGKSTIINGLVGRKLCSISSKVHTTQCKARAIAVENETQLVFLDTPGLVTQAEVKRHHLEASFETDGKAAMVEADIVGVAHDVSNAYCRDRLDPKVLNLLHLHPKKHTVLILNKVDAMKSKRKLLDVVRLLTKASEKNQQENTSENELKSGAENYVSQKEWFKKLRKERGWPHFKDIFMISALTGDGMEDLKEYFLHYAKPNPWMFSQHEFSDRPLEALVIETVRSKLLDNLPNEVPYNITTSMEYFEVGDEGTISTVVLVGCNTPRLERLVIGAGGARIKRISYEAEQELQCAFRQPMKLKVVVTSKRNVI